MAVYPEQTPQSKQVTPAQKGILWSMGVLAVVALCAVTFLGGYVTRMETNKSASIGAAPGAAQGGATSGGTQSFEALDEIYQVLKDYYVNPSQIPDFDVAKQDSIDGLLNAIGDPNQVYIPPSDVANVQIDESGQYEGIGATMTQKNGQVVIESLIPDYPASKSDLKVGDILLTVDGQSVSGKTTDQVVQLVRGKAGTQVTLGVKHQDGSTENITITRSAIIEQTVHTDQITDAQGNPVTDIAYMRISQFQDNTDKDVANFLNSIKGKPYKGLIIDLRNNPGGSLQATVNILNDLLQPGQTEFIEQDRNGHKQPTQAQRGAASIDPNLPIVVLVNGNSASASELTSGALHDNGRAKIIGQKTYGKGTVNQFIPLPKDGGELYVSIADWLTPNGNLIEGTGITPDIVVPLGQNQDVNSYENDQLYRAIDYIHNGQ